MHDRLQPKLEIVDCKYELNTHHLNQEVH